MRKLLYDLLTYLLFAAFLCQPSTATVQLKAADALPIGESSSLAIVFQLLKDTASVIPPRFVKPFIYD